MIESPYASISGPAGMVNVAVVARAPGEADALPPVAGAVPPAVGRATDALVSAAAAAASFSASMRAVSLCAGAVSTMTAVTTARAATPAPMPCWCAASARHPRPQARADTAEAERAERRLDEAEGEVGQGDGHEHAPEPGQHVRRRAGRRRVVERDEQDDRPVPEVDGVRAGADPARDRVAHDPLEAGRAVGPVLDDAHHDHGRRDRGVSADATPETVSVDCSPSSTIAASSTQRRRAGTAYDPGRPQREGATHVARRGLAQRERERRAGHEPHEVGVGAVVDARRVEAGGERPGP